MKHENCASLIEYDGGWALNKMATTQTIRAHLLFDPICSQGGGDNDVSFHCSSLLSTPDLEEAISTVLSSHSLAPLSDSSALPNGANTNASVAANDEQKAPSIDRLMLTVHACY